MHICQAEISALEAVGEAFVVEAHEVQDRGVEVVDMDFTGVDAEAEFVGAAVDVAGLDAATGHPHCEGVDVVIPTD